MTPRLALAIALASSLGLPLAGCVVLDAPHGHRMSGGPPAHAPAHGYRRNHQGHDLVFDDDLGVYAVVGLSNVWFLDGTYFRIRGDRWEISAGTGGPWRVATVSAVPDRLYAKRHPHGAPPGQAKKQGRGKKK
jgi:hypothetical protein